MVEEAKSSQKKKQPHGGPRDMSRRKGSVGGRHVGTPNERTKMLKAIGDKALRDGVVPLEVMLTNMRFYHNKAEKICADVTSRIDQLMRGSVTSVEELKSILADYAKMVTYREQAGAAAVDAAPYCHPRLSAIHVSGSLTKRVELAAGVPPQEALEAFKQNLRSRPAPLAIDHQAAEQAA